MAPDERRENGAVPSFQPSGEQGTDTWQPLLDRQMRAWRDDPALVDEPPRIDVSVPKDAFIKMDSECVLGIPPDLAYDVICDPGNRRVFKSIKGVVSRVVVEDHGERQLVRVHQLAGWRFLFFSGTFGVNLNVIQDRGDHTMSFDLAETGFMKHFRGKWTLEALPLPPSNFGADPGSTTPQQGTDPGSTAPEQSADPGSTTPQQSAARGSTAAITNEPQLPDLSPLSLNGLGAPEGAPTGVARAEGPCMPWYGRGTRIATRARIVQEVSPAFIPPPGIAHLLRGISANVTKEMLRDFQTEAARLRHGLAEDCDVQKELRRLSSCIMSNKMSDPCADVRGS